MFEPRGWGIASLVLGICSIVFALLFAPIGLICGVLGFIFSFKQKKVHANGISTAGFVTSLIGGILSLLFVLLWIIIWIFFMTVQI